MALSKTCLSTAILFLSVFCFGQIPILNSYPSITDKVIYLDLDGQVVSGTGWNSGNTVNALPSTLSPANIMQVFRRISEDYRPFDVNITTDSVRFNNALPNKRIRVIITPTSAWYGNGAGGVAFLGSFTWGGTPGTPCWIFENMLGFSTKNIAEAAAHEVGHTLTLSHQSTYNNACVKTAEYNAGQGNGMTSWAPIMGVGYSDNVTVWYNGKSSLGCNIIQNDHSNSGTGITSPGYLNFFPDDVGNTAPTAKILNLSSINLLDSGLITQPTDIDAYTFTICDNRYVTLDLKPWALDTNNYSGANLDVKLFLYNSSNNQLAVDTPLTRLNARIGMNLVPGTYWFTVDGGRSNYYSDYGSLGKYYVRVKATNPPVLSNTIVLNSSICSGQSTSLNCISNGVATQWLWTISGPTTATYNTQNPTLIFNTGIYTITLLAGNNLSPGCPVTKTLDVNPIPLLSVNNPTTILCYGSSRTLLASGASSYTWFPGAFTGTSQLVAPLTTTSYTINGSTGSCSTSTITTITVNPNFAISATAFPSTICEGEPVTITAGGAANYTINPGGINSNTTIVYPSTTTQYVVTGKNNNCGKVTAITVTVEPQVDLFLIASTTEFCTGEAITLNGYGASSYTFNPGNIVNNIAIVTPSATTIYTLTGKNVNGMCAEDTVITLTMKDCSVVGIQQNENTPDHIRIYPNPSHGYLTIETKTNTNAIEIFNSLGQLIKTDHMIGKPMRIITESWKPGIYFVKLVAGTTVVQVEKIIIE